LKQGSHPTLTGVTFAIGAAALFGASTPFAKILLKKTEPVLLAGLLYLGSGVGLLIWRWLSRHVRSHHAQEASLKLPDLPWLAGAILSGGILGPVLLLIGLRYTPASSASLLLNLEGVLTALLAWFVFKENFDRRIAFGMATITAGGLLLSWTGRPEVGVPWGALAIAGACFAWAIDNNLTRKVSANDPVQIAAAKGLVAATVNLSIAFALGSPIPSVFTIAAAGAVGLLGYGVSLTFFVLALRQIGTARTGAYFSLAPFVGAAISIVLLHDGVTLYFLFAAVLMGIGVWLHLTERHVHEHKHEELAHEHMHVHDAHHQHEHDSSVSLTEPHSHPHVHRELVHSHHHYPDIHHRHPQ
jgi:drug/metabolite transporter (DMT)-like permease